ncbi:TlpA disulfide reductase family protein [Microbacter margulisiae]|uniref:Peroxiredoxin n=1 Tax=Microbacter margulisiae TaxID=1350067 RepID=A0A7W5H3K1_9PORP|nr:peroxiredoxin [Microbacter margulisiae]
MKRTWFLFVFLWVSLTGMMAQQTVAPKDTLSNAHGFIVKIGDWAPPFIMTLTDGRTIPLWSLKGKVVMLQFTASWCGVCRREMPFIEKDIWQKYKNNPHFALFAIDRDEPLKVAKYFILSTGITYPMALDPGAKHFQLYAHKEAGVTRNVLIDKNGRIVFLTRLYTPQEFHALTEKIAELLHQ